MFLFATPIFNVSGSCLKVSRMPRLAVFARVSEEAICKTRLVAEPSRLGCFGSDAVENRTPSL
jgi:hypothetical protein